MPLLADLPLVSKRLSVLCCGIIPNTSKKAKRIISEVREGPRVNSKERRGGKREEGHQYHKNAKTKTETCHLALQSSTMAQICLFQAKAAISVVDNPKIT